MGRLAAELSTCIVSFNYKVNKRVRACHMPHQCHRTCVQVPWPQAFVDKLRTFEQSAGNTVHMHGGSYRDLARKHE